MNFRKNNFKYFLWKNFPKTNQTSFNKQTSMKFTSKSFNETQNKFYETNFSITYFGKILWEIFHKTNQTVLGN